MKKIVKYCKIWERKMRKRGDGKKIEKGRGEGKDREEGGMNLGRKEEMGRGDMRRTKAREQESRWIGGEGNGNGE